MPPSHIVEARPPSGPRRAVPIVEDPDLLATVREDAAHYPGGHAAGLVLVESEADIAAILALRRPVLAIGAQSSLTGGATPRGEIVLSTRRLTDWGVRGGEAEAGVGLSLEAVQQALVPHALLYPPVPTYAGAFVGGTVATNAAGPATFKYGTTRDWVTGLTVVLASGDVLDLRRGETRAHPDGFFEIVTSRGPLRVPVVPVNRPAVPKCSAGYALAAEMDLVDLFIGAEGTLGILTRATLRLVTDPPVTCLVVIALPRDQDPIDLVEVLRAEAHRTWLKRDPRGIDVSAIEHADHRSLALLREDGADREHGLTLADDVATLLLVTVDLPSGMTNEEAWRMLETALDADAPDTPLGRLCRLLDARGLLDRTELALPGDAARQAALHAAREAIPQAVNGRVARAQQNVSPSISKMAGDFVVPFDAFRAMERACREACARRDLDLAIWGHVSDGNIHPNVIPRRADDVRLGQDALLEAGRAVIALGGSPLAEHGVGRNALKQRLLELLHGPEGLAAMRAVKRALDPDGLLAPGVLLPTLAV